MTINVIIPSLFGITKMNLQQQSRNAIYPSLFGSDSLSLFGNQQMNPQQKLELETERRSKELAKEDEMKLRKFEDDVLRRAILAAYRIQGF
jgi:hypothetical protein